WLESESQPLDSSSVAPTNSFVAESKQSDRNRKPGEVATMSPATVMASKVDQSKFHSRDVVIAVSINEGLQNSNMAHKVGGEEATAFCHNNGKLDDSTEDCNHRSEELGLDLVNNMDANMGLCLYFQDIIGHIGEMEQRDAGLFAEVNQEAQAVNEMEGNYCP
ncbi:hypothetical protein Ancab_004583, partial [Ancistrocladus abbreviatus]